jgi:hypothetical protein
MQNPEGQTMRWVLFLPYSELLIAGDWYDPHLLVLESTTGRRANTLQAAGLRLVGMALGSSGRLTTIV